MREGKVSDNRRWPDLRLRMISAAVMVPVGVALILQGGVIFTIFVALVGAGMAFEGLEMQAQSGRVTASWRKGLLCIWPAVCALLTLQGDGYKVILFALYSGIFGLRVLALMLPICLGVASLILLRSLPDFGAVQVLFVVTVVIASDSCAYLSGRCFGGPKLAPRISPSKTRSGAIGGLFGAALIGFLWAEFVTPEQGSNGLVVGAVLGLFAQGGDLLESLAKRRLGVKDSGRLIPGHGGLLDRMDGLLGAAPIAGLLALFSHGGAFWSLNVANLFRHVVS